MPQVYVNAKQYHCIMRRRAKRAAAAAKNQQLLQRKVRDLSACVCTACSATARTNVVANCACSVGDTL